ncbi:Helix-hairpin-helix motif-containing protein [Candidatus Electrothrix aarhusensis]|uniref:Helix-hairpin-helix motif-containing protein n=1 Tax=Candidatus Electrothrix aarhusensis TaxID=1859131 RepID=A0A3S3UBS4_9BACT|nr:Helix-hairpin-helix motif-containing protein [Candidatus Electrothrix aarhusensis]
MYRKRGIYFLEKDSTERDLRVPVLLILGAIILAVSWSSPEPELQTSLYYLAPAASPSYEGKAEVVREVVRIPREQANQDALNDLPLDMLAITPDLPCGTAPPELTQLFNLPLPINQADQKSLMLLPGIGPKLAERIITFREGQGPINGPEDLRRIHGIGPKTTARLTPLLCFAPFETTP